VQRVYDDLPDRDAIRGWSSSERQRRIARATERPYGRQARYADAVLKQLLAIESERCAALLENVIAVDRERDPFRIESVESAVSLSLSGATFNLRCDRIDRHDDGALIVIDYKTGSRRRFLTSGEPDDLQLVLYACALDAGIAGLALFNVDSRETGLDGAGPAFDAADDWPQRLDEWKNIVRAAAAMIAAGDVRLNVQQTSRDARPLDVLSRYAELRRES
ncbi:MAG: PD-(D/E)XK nuclease family protein, partial [Woeseiaceae bacterium]|nr:PD-(D/E)XK nuclease family protein [Woeseiaceae bacterium]